MIRLAGVLCAVAILVASSPGSAAAQQCGFYTQGAFLSTEKWYRHCSGETSVQVDVTRAGQPGPPRVHETICVGPWENRRLDANAFGAHYNGKLCGSGSPSNRT